MAIIKGTGMLAFLAVAFFIIAMMAAPTSSDLAVEVAESIESAMPVQDYNDTLSVSLPPVAQQMPPVGTHHQEHTPALNEEARVRAEAVIEAWPQVSFSPNPNWDKPPSEGDRVRCAITVIGGETVRVIVFVATKMTPSNVYGVMNIWNADGSGWVTSFEDARFGKELRNPDRAIKDFANGQNKGVINRLVDCVSVGMYPPPPSGLTAP